MVIQLISYLFYWPMQDEVYDPEYPYIPVSMFLFFPTRKEDLYSGEGKMFKRYIFQGNELENITDFEKQQLQNLKLYIKQREHKLPIDDLYDPFWTIPWKLRWLVSLRFDIKRAVKEMVNFAQYLKTNRFNLTETAQLNLKQGVIYFSGRDSSYRPIIVFNLAKVSDLSLTGQPLFEVLKFFIEFVIEHLLLPGQAETINIIIDCGYTNVFSLLSAVRETINYLQGRFRSRLKAAYLNKIPPTASFLWGIVRKFLQEDTLKKIFLIKGENVIPLLSAAHPSQIEIKYGGTQDNITTFWPIRKACEMNSNEFHCQTHYPKLMSVQQYQEMEKRGELKNYRISGKLLKEESKNKFEEHMTEAPVNDSTNKEQILDSSIVFAAEKYPLQPEQVDLKTLNWLELEEELMEI